MSMLTPVLAFALLCFALLCCGSKLCFYWENQIKRREITNAPFQAVNTMMLNSDGVLTQLVDEKYF